MKIDHLDHIAISVNDVEKSVKWYQDILGLERRYENAWGNYPAVVCAGNTCIAIFPIKTDNPKPIPDKETISMRHFAFRVNKAEFNIAQNELTQKGIKFEFQDHDISHSIYFNDLDGYEIELTTYEL